RHRRRFLHLSQGCLRRALCRRRTGAEDDVCRAALPVGGATGTRRGARPLPRLHRRARARMGRAPARRRAALAARASRAGCRRAHHRVTCNDMPTVSLDSLNASDAAAFVTALGDIYEHAPWVAQAVYGARPFATLATLHAAMMAAVRTAAPER